MGNTFILAIKKEEQVQEWYTFINLRDEGKMQAHKSLWAGW